MWTDKRNKEESMAKSYVQPYAPAEAKARELCEGLKTQREKYDAITKWLNRCIAYDYVRATKAKELTGPDIERCFELRIGICLDIAALACCMFRAVKIRANIVFGWASLTHTIQADKNSARVFKYGATWHAWCEVYVDGRKLLYDQMIEQKNQSRTRNRYTCVYRAVQVRK